MSVLAAHVLLVGWRSFVDTQTFSSNMKDLGNQAESKLDASRNKVADTLHSTADTLRHRAGEGSGRLSSVASKTADRLSRAADYTRSHDFNDVWSDLTTVVRSRPYESIAVALFVGVLVGKSMRRD